MDLIDLGYAVRRQVGGAPRRQAVVGVAPGAPPAVQRLPAGVAADVDAVPVLDDPTGIAGHLQDVPAAVAAGWTDVDGDGFLMRARRGHRSARIRAAVGHEPLLLKRRYGHPRSRTRVDSGGFGGAAGQRRGGGVGGGTGFSPAPCRGGAPFWPRRFRTGGGRGGDVGGETVLAPARCRWQATFSTR